MRTCCKYVLAESVRLLTRQVNRNATLCGKLPQTGTFESRVISLPALGVNINDQSVRITTSLTHELKTSEKIVTGVILSSEKATI